VGVVGTQVIPYMNSSKRAKDIQILSAYATAGVAGYTYHADSATGIDNFTITITPDAGGDVYTSSEEATQCIANEMLELISQNYVTNAADIFQSNEFKKIIKITVTFDFDNKIVSVTASDINGEIPVENSILAKL
jgi:type IV pilus assembly protein PilA